MGAHEKLVPGELLTVDSKNNELLVNNIKLIVMNKNEEINNV